MSEQPLRLLLVEDDDDDALLFREHLDSARISGPVRMHRAKSAAEGWARLEGDAYDVLVVDYRLGAEDGLAFLRAAREKGVQSPAIFLTGRGDEEVAVQAMKAGAVDYLVKSRLGAGQLGASLRYAVDLHRSRTRQVEAERAREESEARYRRVFDRALTANYVTTPAGRMLACNAAFVRLFGFASAEEAMDTPTYMLYPSAEARDRFLRALAERHHLEGYEDTLRRRDGSAVEVVEDVVAVRDGAGALVEIQGSILDVTERRRAERALRESERHLQAIVDGMPAVVSVKTLDGRYIRVNRAWEAWSCRSWQEAIGRTDFELWPRTIAESLAAQDRNALDGARPVETEDTLAAAGVARTHLTIRFTLPDAAGRPYALCAVGVDVTERRALKDQLIQAQKMEAVGRLAGGVAHDFNNMMSVVTGYSELLEKRLPPDDPNHRPLHEIRKAAERAADLTRQLLAFSRRQIMSPRVLCLNSVVLETEQMLRRLIREDIDLRMRLDPGAGCVRADPVHLSQVLMNLAINSRDAMPHGGSLVIETAPVELDEAYARTLADVRPGPYVMLAVSDTGDGMTPEVRERIFEPFFTTKPQGKGTGLGLSTVFGIVNQSGGHVTVDSEPGRGTTFRVYLPQVAEAEEPEAAPPPAPAEAAPAFETVMVAEDEPALRALIRETLETAGYSVLEAGSGAEAVAVAQRHEGPIHLLLSDLVMPGMTGRELSDRLAPSRPEVRTLYMSGYTEDGIVHQGEIDDEVTFIAKPFTPDALLLKVRAVLAS